MKNASLLLLMLILIQTVTAQSSPTAPAMMDGNGCHACKSICSKFGLDKGEHHCHIFSPESSQTYTRAAAGAASNPETMFAENVLNSLDYISLNADRSGLKIGAMEKNIQGDYKVMAQSCGFGDEKISIRSGSPEKSPKIFGVITPGDTSGLYTIHLQGADYLAIGFANNRLIVINRDDDIVCGGQSVKEKLYLYCKSTLSNKHHTGTSGYCRTSLINMK